MRRIALFTCTLFLVLTACAAQADEVVVTLGGDCVLGTREEWKDDAETFDTLIAEKGFDWCFSKICEPFLNDDISLVNLETVLQSHSEGHARGKEFTFRGDPSYTGILKAAGIEQVNIANNHYIDFGGSGRESTRAALEAAGIGFSGYTYRSVVEVNGYRIGFAGCRETVYLDRKAPVYNDLEALREAGCDAIIYSFHWGKEYSPTHNQTQRRMADYAIQHGADIVVGTHPHCVQGVEHRRGSLILWSLGNLVFGGNVDPDDRDAYLARVTFTVYEDHCDAPELTVVPIRLTALDKGTDYRPVVADEADSARIFKRIMKLSSGMGDFVNGELTAY